MSFVTALIVSTDNLIHVITAKQVVVNPSDKAHKDERLMAFFNGKDGKRVISIRTHEKLFSIKRKIIL